MRKPAPYIIPSKNENWSIIQDLVDIAWKSEENHENIIGTLEENGIIYE